MMESDSIIEHANKMIVIAKELLSLRYSTPERMQVSPILESLSDYWKPVVVALSLSLSGASMQNLPMMLTLEYERINKMNKPEALIKRNSSTNNKINKESKSSHANFIKNRNKWHQNNGIKKKRFFQNFITVDN